MNQMVVAYKSITNFDFYKFHNIEDKHCRPRLNNKEYCSGG